MGLLYIQVLDQVTLVLSAFSDYHDTSYIDTASSELKVWDAFQLGQVGFNRPPWYGCGYATCKYSCTGCAGHYYVDDKGHGSYYWGATCPKGYYGGITDGAGHYYQECYAHRSYAECYKGLWTLKTDIVGSRLESTLVHSTFSDYHSETGNTVNKYPGICGWGAGDIIIATQTGMMNSYLEDIGHYAYNWGSRLSKFRFSALDYHSYNSKVINPETYRTMLFGSVGTVSAVYIAGIFHSNFDANRETATEYSGLYSSRLGTRVLSIIIVIR